MKHDILVADDEKDICLLISGLLEDEGYQTRTATNSDEILEAIKLRQPSLVILDIWLQNSKMDGLEVLDVIKSFNQELPVIIISGHGTIETAIRAIRKGAHDFLEKPFKSDKLILTIQNTLEIISLKNENTQLKKTAVINHKMIGHSSTTLTLHQKIQKTAKSNSRVFITGDAGTGKELTARLIHKYSDRAENCFFAINAATMNPRHVEAELFGEENGNGHICKIGLFEIAHNGVLLLDEIGLMPLETQGKLTRVLVNQTFKRVRGQKNVNVDVRIISSSTLDLHELIREGRFRESLFHRLNVIHLPIPSLKERKEDIPVLFKYFIKTISGSLGLTERKVTREAMASLQFYDWPGNIRQLRNTAERIMILANRNYKGPITVKELPDEITTREAGSKTIIDPMISLPLKAARRRFEREYLINQVNRFDGNISRTAHFIGMERSALHRKLKTLELSNHFNADKNEHIQTLLEE